MSLDLESNGLKRRRSEQEARPTDPRRRCHPHHTEWAVCLTGFSLEETTASDLSLWVSQALKDGNMLQEDLRGPSVTNCQLNSEEGNAYIEFRSEAEHGHFVKLRQAFREGDGMITIQNWEDRGPTPAEQPTPSSPTREISERTEENEDHTGPGHEELPSSPAVMVFLHVPKLFHQLSNQIVERLTVILQQEKFVGLTKQAFTDYSILSTKAREGLQLEVPTEELAERLCFCNGKTIEFWESGDRKRICLRFSRDQKCQQLPTDWYAYLWKFHGRPDINGKLFLRACLSCADRFPLGQSFAAENERRFEAMLNHYGLTEESNRPSLVVGCWAMRDSRLSYDFLVMTKCPKASSTLCALKVCGDVTIAWSRCHENPTLGDIPLAGENMQMPHAPSQSSNSGQAFSQSAAAIGTALYNAAPTREIPTKASIDGNLAVFLSVPCCPNLMEIMEEINRVMQQEKFVKPHERAIVSYLQINGGKKVKLEACSELVAEKLCLCNGMLIVLCDTMNPINSKGFCLRLSREWRFPQTPMDWYAYHLKTYGCPVPGCESIIRMSIADPKPSDPKPWMLTDLLCSEASKLLDTSFNGLLRKEASKNSALVLRCIHMKLSRTGYDYLVMTNSPDTASDLMSMSTCGDTAISWSPCHLKPKLEKRTPSLAPMQGQASENRVGNQCSGEGRQTNGHHIIDLPMKSIIPCAVAVYLSSSMPDLLVPIIHHLNTVMREEKFIGPNAQALVAYQQPMARWCVLEACTEQVAERLCLCTGKLVVLFENTARSTLCCIRLCRHRLYPQMQIDWHNYLCQRRRQVTDRYSSSLLRATLTDQNPFRFYKQLVAFLKESGPEDESIVSHCWYMRDSRMSYDYLVLASSPEGAMLLSSVTTYGDIRISWSFCQEEQSRSLPEPATAALDPHFVPPIASDVSKNIDVSTNSRGIIAENRENGGTAIPLERRKQQPVSPQVIVLQDSEDVRSLAPVAHLQNGHTGELSENLSEQDHELNRMREALSTMTRQYNAQTIEFSQSNEKLKDAVEQRVACQDKLAMAWNNVQQRRDIEENRIISKGLAISPKSPVQIRQSLFKVTHQYKTQSVEFSQAKDRLSHVKDELKEESEQRTQSQNELDASRSELQERDRQFCSITGVLTMLTNQQVEDRKTILDLNDSIVAEKERYRSTKTALKDIILKQGALITTTRTRTSPATNGNRGVSSETRVPSPVQSSTRVTTMKMDQEREQVPSFTSS